MAKKTIDDDDAVRDKIAALPAFRDIAIRLHEVITHSVPDLHPRLWYGMPGYAKAKRSPVFCFFRVDDDDYLTFGLTESAQLAPDPSAGHQLIQSSWFLTVLDAATEARIADIVRSAAGSESTIGEKS